jgi:hypothetical protein
LIVDGGAEYASLPALLPRIDTHHTLIQRVLRAHVHPLAPVGNQVRAVLPRVREHVMLHDARKVIVLLDREGEAKCPGTLGDTLKAALEARCAQEGLGVAVDVCIKDRMFENWLVSDLKAFRTLPKRFHISKSFESQVAPDRADRADAVRLLKTAAIGKPYHKVDDAKRILKAAEPLRIGANSRSFRRFLRVSGSRTYAHQSRVP